MRILDGEVLAATECYGRASAYQHACRSRKRGQRTYYRRIAGWQLRAALPPLRLHSVSLYDEQANVLWLSEGALGPDEHNVVLEAMETLANDRSLPCYENGLEDGRVGIFLPVRAPQGDLVGVAMILADLKSVGDGVLEKIVSPQVRTIMQKVAVLLRASSARPGEPPAPIPVAVAPVLELTPERAPGARTNTCARRGRTRSHQRRPFHQHLSAPAPAPKATTAAPAKPAANTKLNGSHGSCDSEPPLRRLRRPAPAAPVAAARRPTVALAPGYRRHPGIRAVSGSGNASTKS